MIAVFDLVLWVMKTHSCSILLSVCVNRFYCEVGVGLWIDRLFELSDLVVNVFVLSSCAPVLSRCLTSQSLLKVFLKDLDLSFLTFKLLKSTHSDQSHSYKMSTWFVAQHQTQCNYLLILFYLYWVEDRDTIPTDLQLASNKLGLKINGTGTNFCYV